MKIPQSLFILILLSFFIKSESIAVDCKFTFNPKYGYTCIVMNDRLISSKDDREITQIKRAHSPGKTNDDVKFFQTLITKVKFFPKGILKFFKNLEVFEIKNGKLEEIHGEDLKEFGGNLKKLWLSGNDLKVIEGNLFKFNGNLEKIGLDSNQIEKVESGAFEGLEKLQSLFLRWNLCTNEEDLAENDRAKVLKLIKNVESKCGN